MKIKSVKLKKFMAHDDSELALPDHGVVVITGHNGAGKSTFMEGVATGLWNKTLRGSKPWREGVKGGSVTVTTDRLQATRKGSKMAWHYTGEKPVEFESTTHAQKALIDAVGEFDVWRRTSVFSSSDVSHFTLATDAQRKRLIEQLLGLDRFDPAHAKAKEELKALMAEAEKQDRAMYEARLKHTAAVERVAEIKSDIKSVPDSIDVATLVDRAREVQQLGNEVKERLEQIDAKVLANQEKVNAKRLVAVEASATYKAILGPTGKLEQTCPTCGQDIVHFKQLETKAEEARHAYQEAKEAYEAISSKFNDAQPKVRAKRSELNAELDRYREELQTIKFKIKTAKADKEARDSINQKLWDAERLVDDIKKQFTEAKSRVEQVQREVDKMKVVERVLSTKGVRSYVLGKTLSGIEQVANAWLPRIASGELSVKLSPYSEKKTGGVSDSISLEVLGAGGGHGYKGASGGERRRIDVALLLALSEIAGASAGREGSTLFFDEVFDALDDEGVESVCQVLQELGQQQAVVVITHSEQMIKALHGAQRLHLG